jgi:hypothetical protein
LAAYARFDLGLRLGKPGAALIIQRIVPTTFTNTCLDIAGAQGCSASSVQGAIVGVADGAVLHAYHVGMRGGVAYLGQGAISPVEPADAPAARAAQLAMRQDLSKRLGVSPETISVVTFHRVTWSDGCIGVYAPGQICTQALVQGYFALLADSAGLQYEYHGADSGFIAATFERGSTVRQPTITQGR